MSERALQRNMPGILTGLFFFMLAIQSGVLPLAVLLGGVASIAVWGLSRQGQPALWTGGSVAGVIMVIGILNMLVPGWHQHLIEAVQVAVQG